MRRSGKEIFARLQSCGSHLIDKRRKLVVVILIHDDHLEARLAQTHSKLQAAESSSHNDHSCQLVDSYIGSHNAIDIVTSTEGQIACHTHGAKIIIFEYIARLRRIKTWRLKGKKRL